MSKINMLVITHNKDQMAEQIKRMESWKEKNDDFNYKVTVVNTIDDYNHRVHGMEVQELYFPYISNVSQEIYELLRARVRR